MLYAQGRVINFNTQGIMTINELLGKPVWQMTGEELLFLAQHGNMSTSGETAKVSFSKEEKRNFHANENNFSNEGHKK